MITSRFFLVAPALASLFYAASATAYPAYPSELAEAGQLECTPGCIVCHEGEVGEKGTANQEFLGTMLDAGLGLDDNDSVGVAWRALGNADTDGDGVPDQEELTSNPPSNVNDASSTPDDPGEGAGRCGGEAKYGCGAQLASSSGSSPNSAWTLLGLFGVAMVVARRRIFASS